MGEQNTLKKWEVARTVTMHLAETLHVVKDTCCVVLESASPVAHGGHTQLLLLDTPCFPAWLSFQLQGKVNM